MRRHHTTEVINLSKSFINFSDNLLVSDDDEVSVNSNEYNRETREEDHAGLTGADQLTHHLLKLSLI